MRKERFESRIRELLPEASDAALKKWVEYAQELDRDGTEHETDFYDSTYVELSLIKQHQGLQTATELFNYGEHFTFNPFELRGAASLLTEGWPLEKIQAYAVENGCDPTEAEYEESEAALEEFKTSERPWYLRLTLVNGQTNEMSMIMYPSEKSEIMEAMDECQLPYGSGEYYHLATSANGVRADKLQAALARVIENEEHPPSTQELNYLGRQLRGMSHAERSSLTLELLDMQIDDITDAINTVYRFRSENSVYDGVSMAERAVFWDEHDPILRVELLPEDTEDIGVDSVWVDCPAEEADLEAAARTLGIDSVEDADMGALDGILSASNLPLFENESPFVSFSDINRLAHAIKENGVINQLAKFKAVLLLEYCMEFYEAADLAERLNEYEFFSKADLIAHCHGINFYDGIDQFVNELGFEEFPYGYVRKAGELDLDQQVKEILSEHSSFAGPLPEQETPDPDSSPLLTQW